MVLAAGCAGCISGSLASTTGDCGSGRWSADSRQRVHVGETVEFSFALRDPLRPEATNAIGLADYCVFQIGSDRLEADIDERGRFRTACTFDDLRPDETVSVTASAYRECGGRDFKEINGTWLRNQSPYNEADEIVASSRIRLTGYRSRVRLALPRPTDEYDFSTARLLLRRRDGHTSAVYLCRPPRGGFKLEPRSARDGWWVCYQPDGDEVNPCGTTEVVFSVYDQAGNEHRITGTMETP